MNRWRDALAAAVADDGRAVLVTVAATSGSTPRESGASMVVGRETCHGTIGGGHLEFEALRIAREALAESGAPSTWLVRFPLAARLGQCCGGVASLAFALVDARSLPTLDTIAACERTAAAFAIVGRIASGDDAVGRIVVGADFARGTLGDRELDSHAVRLVRERLRAGRGADGTGIVSVAGATLFVHVVRPAPFDVLLFGNGHVGRALVQVLGALPAQLRWIDAREDDFPAGVPANVEIVATDVPEAEIDGAPRGACVIVMTHSHALDFALVEAALGRDDWGYLGMIGSKAKRAQFERRLAAKGVAAATLARLTCPIGVGGIRSKEPGAIAVAVAAELLARREASGERLSTTTARRSG